MKDLAYLYRSLVMTEYILMHNATCTEDCILKADPKRVSDAQDLAYEVMAELKSGQRSGHLVEFFDHKDAKRMIEEIRKTIDNKKNYGGTLGDFGLFSSTSMHTSWANMCKEITSYPDAVTEKPIARAMGGGTIILINSSMEGDVYAVSHSMEIHHMKKLIDQCNEENHATMLHSTLMFALQMGVSIIELPPNGKAHHVTPYLINDSYIVYKQD